MSRIGGKLLARELEDVVAQPAADITTSPSANEPRDAIAELKLERRTWATCAIGVSSGRSNEYGNV
jgi:hypothetical protein